MCLEKFSLTGKRALVTGAARGIGAAIAEALGEVASLMTGSIVLAEGGYVCW